MWPEVRGEKLHADCSAGTGATPSPAGPSHEDNPQPPTQERPAVHRFLKSFSFVVLALMGSGIAYACYIGLTYWTGIGV